MTAYEFRDLIKISNGWVIRNLKKYHNSVLPSELITCAADVRIGEKLLSVILDQPVQIRKTESGYVCER